MFLKKKRRGKSFCDSTVSSKRYSVPVIGTSNKIQGRNSLEKGLQNAVLLSMMVMLPAYDESSQGDIMPKEYKF